LQEQFVAAGADGLVDDRDGVRPRQAGEGRRQVVGAMSRRLLAVDLDGPSKTRIVAIAGAVAKAPAIRAVLESGRLTGLITDEPTARALLA